MKIFILTSEACFSPEKPQFYKRCEQDDGVGFHWGKNYLENLQSKI